MITDKEFSEVLKQIAIASNHAHMVRQGRLHEVVVVEKVKILMDSVRQSPMEERIVKEVMKRDRELEGYQSQLRNEERNPSDLEQLCRERDGAREKYLKQAKAVIEWSKTSNEWKQSIEIFAAELRSLQKDWEKYGEGMGDELGIDCGLL